MMIGQLKEMRNFTPSEKLIAQFVLENPTVIQELTMSELAKRTYISKVAVVRLCKKLEIGGYRQFQRKLESEFNEIKYSGNQINQEPVYASMPLSEIMHQLPLMYEASILSTKLLLDEKLLMEVIEKLRQSDDIEIFGTGFCLSIARQTAFKLNTIGLSCTAFDGINEHYVVSNQQKKRKTAVLLTFTGTNPCCIQLAI